MKAAVWDTYVKKKDGNTMHFDILVPDTMQDPDKVYGYGKKYLEKKGQSGQPLTATECRFCHVEQASQKVQDDIEKQGYSIIEMEGCED